MRACDFAAAWRISDAALAARDPGTRDDPGLPYHLRWVWDGTPPDGRDVLVRCYHGLGDTLQFARFLPALAARARSVLVEAPAALVPLLSPLVPVVPFDVAAPLPRSDCDIEMMELSHALRMRPDAAPPWLAPTGTERFQAIALCWQAGDWDQARSLALPQLLRALPDARLLSLQRGRAAAEATDARFLNPQDDDRDLSRTARLICAATHVVTVDTAVAHLAGSLGAPTTLLLKHDPDWRWQHGEGVSAWYPSVHMLRQHAPGDWSAPLSALSRG